MVIYDDILQKFFFPALSVFFTIGIGEILPCPYIIDVKGFYFPLWNVYENYIP